MILKALQNTEKIVALSSHHQPMALQNMGVTKKILALPSHHQPMAIFGTAVLNKRGHTIPRMRKKPRQNMAVNEKRQKYPNNLPIIRDDNQLMCKVHFVICLFLYFYFISCYFTLSYIYLYFDIIVTSSVLI